MSQRSGGLTLHRNSMVIDLIIECFAKDDRVFAPLGRCSIGPCPREPELHMIEEVESSPIDNVAADGVVVRSKEDGRGEDPLESLDDASIVPAVFGHMEE